MAVEYVTATLLAMTDRIAAAVYLVLRLTQGCPSSATRGAPGVNLTRSKNASPSELREGDK